MDVPSLGFDPMRCLNVRRFSMTSRDRMLCAKPKAQVLAEQAPMRALVEELKQQHPKMRTFDPIPALCDDEYCYAIRDKKMLYRDGDHLSPEGSARVARAFKEAWPKR